MVLLSLCLLLGVAAAFQPEPKEHYQAGCEWPADAQKKRKSLRLI